MQETNLITFEEYGITADIHFPEEYGILDPDVKKYINAQIYAIFGDVFVLKNNPELLNFFRNLSTIVTEKKIEMLEEFKRRGL